MVPIDPTVLADLAERVAEQAADTVRDARAAGVRVAETKSSTTDLVTETDRAVEALIIDELTAARPDDAILAEEGGSRDGTSDVTWIIDPIDGTTNFYYSLAGFNISIAAAVEDRVVAGVVVDPVRNETFRATRGGGSTCNGTTLAGGSPRDLSHALIGTGFAYRPERRRAQAAVVAHLIGEVRDIRRLGAAALDLCYVAAGRLDGYFESGLAPWDLAAGALIASEAGCHLSGPSGDPPDGRLTVAASVSIAPDLVKLLDRVGDAGLDVVDPSARIGWEFGKLVV